MKCFGKELTLDIHDCDPTAFTRKNINEIPIIMVKENKPIVMDDVEGDVVYVENYLEAAGWIMSKRAGVHPSSVRSD